MGMVLIQSGRGSRYPAVVAISDISDRLPTFQCNKSTIALENCPFLLLGALSQTPVRVILPCFK